MFLYVCLVLLPATVLASHDSLAETCLFDAIDTNKDGKIQRSETNTFYQALDKDGNKCLTLVEAKEQVPSVASKIKGQEESLYVKFDLDRDNCITERDVNCMNMIVDINKDGDVSRIEYNLALRLISLLPNTSSLLIHGFCKINNLS